MQFHIVERGAAYERIPGHGYLHVDYWDDWGKYRTQFPLSVVDASGEEHHVGAVKFGQKGLLPSDTPKPGRRTPSLPTEFERLNSNYFSLGQNETYYETLEKLGAQIRSEILIALRDCAYDLSIFEDNLNEDVMTESLLRLISHVQVKNRFSRLAHGNSILTAFRFEYEFPQIVKADGTSHPVPKLQFSVSPLSTPLSNVHVLIGRNGVGKTRCMQSLASAILRSAPPEDVGQVVNIGSNKNEWAFAGLVYVSFSAFDDYVLPSPANSIISSNQIGLHSPSASNEPLTLPQRLTQDFQRSFNICRRGPRADRWRTVVDALSSDPLFREADVASLLDVTEDDPKNEIENFFTRLSSGHKIVLLTITRLVEVVDEATVILLDEPEVHLHPPLLSAFVRGLADLLTQRNGVAIIATHSPVILQEVPSSCVWKLYRSGVLVSATRPTENTFGENVGTLTREVFGLEVTESGFYRVLIDKVRHSQLSFEELLAEFDGTLGGEARAILRALVFQRDQGLQHA